MLRKIIAHKEEEVKEEWRRLHNEELNNLYSSLNTIPVIQSIRMRRTGHEARE